MVEKLVSSSRVCVACGVSDVRMLIAVPLSDGTATTLCGSHALMYRRGGAQAASVDALRDDLRNRRASRDRRAQSDRSVGEIDDLGAQLSAAFAGERRGSGDRRTG